MSLERFVSEICNFKKIAIFLCALALNSTPHSLLFQTEELRPLYLNISHVIHGRYMLEHEALLFLCTCFNIRLKLHSAGLDRIQRSGIDLVRHGNFHHLLILIHHVFVLPRVTV